MLTANRSMEQGGLQQIQICWYNCGAMKQGLSRFRNRRIYKPPVTAAILTEGMVFLSTGTTLKGFGKAASVPTAWSWWN